MTWRLFFGRSLLAGLFLVASLGGRGHAASFDFETLKTIPMMDVVRLATLRYEIILGVDDQHRVVILKDMDGLDPKVRTLLWLAILESELTDSMASNNYAPIRFSTQGYFLSQMKAALRDAGMDRRAALFEKATAGIEEHSIDPNRKPPVNWAVTDFKFMPLGDAFGTKRDFDDAIEAYIGANPAAREWCEKERAKLSDKDRLEGLLTGLGRIPGGRETLASWPAPYRVIRLVEIYNDEMLNGGVEQYFFNSSGDLAPAAVEALRAIGLPSQAAIVARGMGFFEKPYPTDLNARREAFDHPRTKDWDDRLIALTGDADDGTIEPAMIAYAEREGILPH